MKNQKWLWIAAVILCACVAVISCVCTVHSIKASSEQQEPDYVMQQYETLFANPDWLRLYRLSQDVGNVFEDENTVAAYMEGLVGDQSLRLYETHSDDPAERCFAVYCGQQKIAMYSLSVRDWSLRQLELVIDRSVEVYVHIPADLSVFVNGKLLDDSYLVYSMHTKAEGYLPEGIHGQRMKGYQVTGLLAQPTVTATDSSGQAVEVLYDQVTRVYYTQPAAPAEITQQQLAFVGEAASADALYALAKVSDKELAKYFDTSSALYKMLTENPRNYQKFKSISVEDVKVSQFCQYSETLFSANVTLIQRIIRTSGTLKTYYLDKTYIFQLQENGEYRVIAYTNEHLTEKVESVKLTFVMPSGQQIQQTVNCNANTVTPPEIKDCDGFAGWMTQSKTEDGDIVCTVRLLPDGTVLGGMQSMVLYPYLQVSE